MVILGIDPGTATTGYGLITEDEAGDGAPDPLRCHPYGGRARLCRTGSWRSTARCRS